MKLYEEFKLYENMWTAEANALTESITTHFCDSCKQTVQLDDNAMCPNCSDGISYLTDLVAEVLSEDSKLYIIYNADKESINKADLNLATGHINKGAEVVQVTKEFFSQLEPVIHDDTPEDSDCGKVLLKNEPKIIQLILAELRHHTSILEKALGNPTKQTKQNTSGSSNNQVPDKQKIGFDEEFKPEEPLTESRSIADIEAEIAKLQQELTQAKIAEKKASYGGNLPKTVWAWDIYLEPAAKGTWTSIENDLVFETKDKALKAAWTLLNELDDEGELEHDTDDYYVEAFEVPLSSVSASTLEFSKLAYLI